MKLRVEFAHFSEHVVKFEAIKFVDDAVVGLEITPSPKYLPRANSFLGTYPGIHSETMQSRVYEPCKGP